MNNFKKIVFNAGILVSGSVSSSIIGLVSFTLIARKLGPELFGVLALVQAYAAIIDRLVNFQSWQALIKYGTDALARERRSDLKELLTFGFTLDLTTAFLATIIGVFIPYLISDWLNWSEEKTQMASIFSLIILFNIEGTPTAILRIFDEFKQFAFKEVGVSLLKLMLVLIGFFLNTGIWYFLLTIMVSMIIGYLYLIFASFQVLKKNNIELMHFFIFNSFSSIRKKYDEIWNFIWTTNFHGTVRMASLNLDIIIVDTMLGSLATGLYQVTKQFAKVFTQVTQPLYKSIYPELTKLWAKNMRVEFYSVVKKFSIFGIVFSFSSWLVFFLFGEKIIFLIVGADFTGSLNVLLWYLLGVVISISSFPITPAILAMGFPKLTFYSILFSTIIYFAFLYYFLFLFGLEGAGMANIVLYLTWLSIMLYFYRSRVRKKFILI